MVDLPAPVSPTKASVSPAGITRSMSRSTGRPLDVLEAHVLEPHLPRQLGKVGRAGSVDHGGDLAEQVAHLADRRLALLVGVVELHELLDRREEGGEVEEERHQLADLHRAVEHPVPADHQDHHLAGHADGLGDAAVGGPHRGGDVVGVAVAHHDRAVLGDVAPLAVVRRHDAHAREALLEVRHHVGDPVAHRVEGGVGGRRGTRAWRPTCRHDHEQRDARPARAPSRTAPPSRTPSSGPARTAGPAPLAGAA